MKKDKIACLDPMRQILDWMGCMIGQEDDIIDLMESRSPASNNVTLLLCLIRRKIR